MKLKLPEKIELARTPTPIERLENHLHGIEDYDIFIKRDDLTGSILQGNKIRKLEYFIPLCREQNADILITCGGLQSNHCRAVACLSAIKGLKSYLLLRGNKPQLPQANYLLDKLVGAEIEFVTPGEYAHIDEIMSDRAKRLKSRGLIPFIIPEGGSNAIGLCGYFDCYREIHNQMEEMNLTFDFIFTATGSGGTYGGLTAGTKYYRDRAKVIGINVCYTADHFVNRIFGYLKDFEKKYCTGLDFRRSEINIVDGYVGAGYALSRNEELAVISKMAQSCGLLLDPVYTGKAFFGMLDLLRKKVIPSGSKILFMHTGGLWGLMAIGDRFSDSNLI